MRANFLDGHLFTVNLHGGKGKLYQASFIKSTNSILEGSALMTESPPKSPYLPIPSPWGVRISTHEFGGDTNIQSKVDRLDR